MAFACGAWAPSASAAACAGSDATPRSGNVTETRAAIACLLDAARAERDAPALRRDARLRVAAQRYATALAPSKPLRHKGKGGSSPLERIEAAGYAHKAFSAAETLGRGQGTLATPAARMRAWLANASIKRLLLSPRYRDVGIGVVTRGGVTTFVVELARRGTGRGTD